MPIETTITVPVAMARALDDPRVRRILRFVIAITLATVYSQFVNWTFSFLLVAYTTVFMMMPLPAPSLWAGVWTAARTIAGIGLGVLLMLSLHSHQLFGFALVGLTMFLSYYLLQEGEVTGITPVFLTIGVTLIPAFGSTYMDSGVLFAKGFAKAFLALFPIIWIAFAVLPEGVYQRMPTPPPVEGSSVDRAINALRPVVLLMPLFVYMLGSDNGLSYLVGYFMVQRIAQPASRAEQWARSVDLMLGTVYGATAGVVMWWLVKLWPSLLWFTLMMALFSFLAATRIFSNEQRSGLSPHFFRWAFSVITIVIIVFPVAQSTGFGDAAAQRFCERILDLAFVCSYTVFGIVVYDAIVERLRAWRGWPARNGYASG